MTLLPAGLPTTALTFGPYPDAAGVGAVAGMKGTIVPVDPSTREPVRLVHVATGVTILPKPVRVVLDPAAAVQSDPLPRQGTGQLSPDNFQLSVVWDVPGWMWSPGDRVIALPAASAAVVDFDTMGVAATAPAVYVPVQVQGVPAGGTTGQVLAKASNTDLDTAWVPQTGGGGAVSSVNTKTGAVVLSASDVGADAAGAATTAQAAAITAAATDATSKANAAQSAAVAAIPSMSTIAADTALKAAFGALPKVAATVTASGALVVNKHNPVDASSGAKTMTLPTGQPEGAQVSIEKADASANAVTVTGSVRGVGSSTISLPWANEALLLRADSAGSWWPISGHKTKATLDLAYAPAVSLTKFGLTGATTDIQPIFAAAVAAGVRHVLVPYQAAAWPSLSTINLIDMWMEFEPGARISFNHNSTGMTMLRSRLTNASFTSDRTGPASTADATSPAYAFPAREVAVADDNLIDGSYYQEYAPNGIHFSGAHNRVTCAPRFKNMRHQQGWAACIHASGAGSYDNRVHGAVYIDSCDRGLENEDGAHDIQYLGGGYLKNVYPAGYTGQASAATYANYTFILDAHGHDGTGGPVGIHFGGRWVLENCGGGVTFIRSTGANDSDLPRNCSVDELHFIGLGMSTGYEPVAVQGYNHRINSVSFDVGAGVAGGVFTVKGYSFSRNNSLGSVTGTDAAMALVRVLGIGTRGAPPASVTIAAPTGKYLALAGHGVGTGQLGNNVLRLFPYFVPYPMTWDRFGLNVTVAANAGAVYRLGVYTDSGGLPGEPLLDTTVAVDTTGQKEATISLVLTPGWVWLGGAVQGATTTDATVGTMTSGPFPAFPIIGSAASSVVTASAAYTGQALLSVSGALPSFGGTPFPSQPMPRLFARLAS